DVIDHLNYLGDRYDANDARILELENRLGGDVYNAGAGGGGSVIRPPWAPGWTNNALRELARVNGVDAATDLWWERAGLERGSGELRYAREQVRPGFGGGQQSAAQARAELAQLQAEQHQIAEASRAIEDNPNAAFYRPGEASQALPFDLGGTAGAYPAEGGGAAQAARAGLAAPGEIGGAGAPFGGAQPGLATTAFARLLGGGAAGGYGTYLATDPNDPNRWLKVGAGTLGGALLGGPGVDLAIRAARGGLPSTSIGDLIQATRVGSLAGGIPTLSHIALNTPVQAALKLASDVPADLLRGHWEATPSELYGAMQGFRSWALTAAQTLGHARPTLETGLTGLVGVHPILQDLANQVAQHMELWRGAATAATDAGLTRFSPQWQAEVSRLVGSPTSAMQDAMQQAGQRAALRGPLGTTGQAISDLVRSSPLARFVMPFFNIGYHVATQGLETSPLGLAGTAFDVARGLAGAGPYAQGFAGRGAAGAVTPLAQRLRNNLIGVGLAAEAYNQAGAGNITGDGPSDPNQRRALMDMGWRPNSVNIGGRYIDSHILGPVGWALTQGANVYEATHGPEEGGYRQLVKTPQGERASNPIELLGDVAARQGRYFNDETFLNSMGSVLNLIGSTAQMGRVAPQEAASTLESLIPQGALLSNIASVTDPYARQTTAPATGNIAADVWQAMQSRLPGLRESVPTRLSATGEALPNPQQGLGLLIPRSSPATGNPVLAAMAAASVTPGAPATSVPYGPSGEIRLTPQEQHTWEEYRGQVLQQAASALVQSPSWQQMPLEGQRAALTRINAAASAAAGRMLLRDIAPTIGANRQPVPTGNIAPVQAYLPAGLNDQYLNQAALVQSQLRHRALMQALLGNAAA
ncbi:MAG TPA: hypothetical protein VFB50_19525, partial [Chloroflexota bacterium]|nr:hypothetical protein [Chloroflexota bacterium]